ncbi:NlpC/P60 family protein [Nocardiopsis dassonvillei]|uniref:C40 family peptidase n=1 Tax=Nocardiopsis dassonvillei TaxID=2014 RepID=UPI00200C4140|nr:NlpC/P60 family protein [Nocardiopsis dassonvillei]MCK9871351.1 NlpC/P60 family protein [Nocardiopsis dassonvillei]
MTAEAAKGSSRWLWALTVVLLLSIASCTLPPAIGLIALTGTARSSGATPPEGVEGIPETLLDAYQRAAEQVTDHAPDCAGMTWAVLAGVGKVESTHAAGSTIDPNGDVHSPLITGPTLDGSGAGNNHTPHTDTDQGRWDDDTTYDAAVGPMQFLPSTWVDHGLDGNGDGLADPHNAYDATLSAAVYLCGPEPVDLSDEDDLRAALRRYNAWDTYIDEVAGHIATYTAMGEPAPTRRGDHGDIIAAAEDWLGTPYLYGGACNDLATDRCDCSSLVRYAYRHATGIELPRTTYDQVVLPDQDDRFVHIPPDRLQDLRPGDMLFFGTHAPDGIGHVGLYIDPDHMIEAPRTGLDVRVASNWLGRGTYYGAVGLR